VVKLFFPIFLSSIFLSTLSQHFKILREAGLIRSERKGVELKNSTRCQELKKNFGPMVTAILRAYEKEAHESKH